MMNILMTLILITGVDLFFVEQTTNLLVKVFPSVEAEQVAIGYSFHAADWDTVIAVKKENSFSAVINPPDSVKVIGFFCLYGDNVIDDNNGQLYLYEVSTSPRFIHPFALENMEMMLSQAKKKIVSKTHVDEARFLLDYVRSRLGFVPYIPGTTQEMQLNTLKAELNTIDGLLFP